MSRIIFALGLVLVSLALISCSGSGNNNIGQQVIPNIAGSWEFIAVSSSNGTETGIEVALKEGQSLVGGIEQPDGTVSASSTQIAFVTIDPTSGNATSFGGPCPATQNPSNSLTGSVSALGGAFNFSSTENGNVLNVTATLSGDGQSVIDGTYTSTDCSDSGTIVGHIVPKLSGTYVGQMTLPGSSVDTATATLTQSSGTLTANLSLTGVDNTSFTMTGPVTGNAFSIQGTFRGQIVTYYGYYELTYDCLNQLVDLPTLYLVNAADQSQPGDLLTRPLTSSCPAR
jgi:hypothetical protein